MTKTLALAAAAFVPAAAVAAAPPAYTITPLFAPDGGRIVPGDLNNRGDVVGYYNDPDFNSRPFVLRGGVFTALADLPDGGSADAINDLGQVVGNVLNADFSSRAATWSATGQRTLLGSLGTGDSSLAYGINNAGTIVGRSQYVSGISYTHAFVYTAADGLQDYGSFRPDDVAANAAFNDVNDAGQIVGAAYDVPGSFRAIRADVGSTTLTQVSPEGTLDDWQALKVNAAGVAAGYGGNDAIRFNADGSYDVLDASGLGLSQAGVSGRALNDLGSIVGTANGLDADGNFQFEAFLYEDGRMYDLASLITDFSGWDFLTVARDVNNGGTIIGTGFYNGEPTAFLATPVPEPASLGLAAAAGTLLLRRRR